MNMKKKLTLIGLVILAIVVLQLMYPILEVHCNMQSTSPILQTQIAISQDPRHNSSSENSTTLLYICNRVIGINHMPIILFAGFIFMLNKKLK